MKFVIAVLPQGGYPANFVSRQWVLPANVGLEATLRLARTSGLAPMRDQAGRVWIEEEGKPATIANAAMSRQPRQRFLTRSEEREKWKDR